jgi:serine/threonine protein kinase
MQFDRYHGVIPFPERNLLEAPPEVTRTVFPDDPPHTLLIKVFPPGKAVPRALLREVGLLRSLRLRHVPRVCNVGFDDSLQQHFYAMRFLGSIRKPQNSTGTYERLLSSVKAICVALDALHDEGIAYRMFDRDAFIMTDDGEIQLYDVSTATAFDPTRLIERPAQRREYDPPEAEDGRVDGVRGDIFGLGCWIEAVGQGILAEHSSLADLVRDMKAEAPRLRPVSLGQVLERLEEL